MTASRNYRGSVGRLGPAPARSPELRFRVVHGYRRAFRVAGSGPPLVLIHGIGDSSATWEAIIPALARHHLVIAPDLLGHGRSDKPRADYSVAAYANGVRDLLGVLGVQRATLVGHSLGGGVAMQFAYQFPERTERLVLIGSGGGGPEVSMVLRMLALPGGEALLHLLRLPTARWQTGVVVAALRALDTALGQDAPDLLRVVDALPDSVSRAAFIRSLRSVVDWRGQVITMLDRCYLTQGMPTLLVWGSRDAVVPVAHGYRAHAAMPGSQLEIFEGAGHFPFHTDPARFVETVERFLAETHPATWNLEQWRQLLRNGRIPSANTEAVETASERSAT
ncbi:MAG TPA: alpha/beta fold hydrolase [Pseudonocardia sp.]|jgi:pimeloyl-ACP methyl ester carboxylesterase|nr:alpha/beta fold hydrolase [Pseudonocardia sp.]